MVVERDRPKQDNQPGTVAHRAAVPVERPRSLSRTDRPRGETAHDGEYDHRRPARAAVRRHLVHLPLAGRARDRLDDPHRGRLCRGRDRWLGGATSRVHVPLWRRVDIAGDRIVEMALWVIFADLDLIPIWVPLLVISRGAIVDTSVPSRMLKG